MKGLCFSIEFSKYDRLSYIIKYYKNHCVINHAIIYWLCQLLFLQFTSIPTTSSRYWQNSRFKTKCAEFLNHVFYVLSGMIIEFYLFFNIFALVKIVSKQICYKLKLTNNALIIKLKCAIRFLRMWRINSTTAAIQIKGQSIILNQESVLDIAK